MNDSSYQRQVLAETPYVRLIQENGWGYIERVSGPSVVIIVPLTQANELVFVEQHRIPVGKNVIEFPAGLVGDEDGMEGESIADAAGRELEEETGYYSAELTVAFTGPTSAGLSSEQCTIFIAPHAVKRSAGGGVDNENIISHVIPLPEVEQWLAAQQAGGNAVGMPVYAGLACLARYRS